MSDAGKRAAAYDLSDAEIQRLINRTPEEIERDRLRFERDVAAEKARHPDGYALPPLVVPEPPDSIEELAARVQRKIDAQRSEFAALPCQVAIAKLPANRPDEVVDTAGRASCEAAGAFTGCRFVLTEQCPRLRANALRESVQLNLKVAEVEEEDRKPILAALCHENPVPLLDTDTLRVARGFLRRQLMTVPVRQAGQVCKDGTERIGEVYLTGKERVLGLFGNRGRGKSLAAIYILARRGGRYVLEYDLGRQREAGIDMAELIDATVLVIDQVGRVAVTESRRAAPDAIEELIVRRCSGGRPTVLVGPIAYADFAQRYPDASDRVLGFGAFVQFGGKSLR